MINGSKSTGSLRAPIRKGSARQVHPSHRTSTRWSKLTKTQRKEERVMNNITATDQARMEQIHRGDQFVKAVLKRAARNDGSH